MLNEIMIPVGYDPYDYTNLVVQVMNGLNDDKSGFEIADGSFLGSMNGYPKTEAALDLYRTIVSATYVTASRYSPSYLNKSGDEPRCTDLSRFGLSPDSPEALIYLTSDIVSSVNRGDLETLYMLVRGLETGGDPFRATTLAILAQGMTGFVDLSPLSEHQSSFMRPLARGLAMTALYRGGYNNPSSHGIDKIADKRFGDYDLWRIFPYGAAPTHESDMGRYINQTIQPTEVLKPQTVRALVRVGLVEPCMMMASGRQAYYRDTYSSMMGSKVFSSG